MILTSPNPALPGATPKHHSGLVQEPCQPLSTSKHIILDLTGVIHSWRSCPLFPVLSAHPLGLGALPASWGALTFWLQYSQVVLWQPLVLTGGSIVSNFVCDGHTWNLTVTSCVRGFSHCLSNPGASPHPVLDTQLRP